MSIFNWFKKKSVVRPTPIETDKQLAIRLSKENPGNKVTAIKGFLSETGYGLKEAKAFIDSAWELVYPPLTIGDLIKERMRNENQL